MYSTMEKYPFLGEATIAVLKRLRSDFGFSQEKLAEKSALDRLYVQQIEQGKFRPTLNSIFFLADGLGLEPYEFVKLIELERRKLLQASKTN